MKKIGYAKLFILSLICLVSMATANNKLKLIPENDYLDNFFVRKAKQNTKVSNDSISSNKNLTLVGQETGNVTLTTDKNDYQQGEIVIITGGNWLPGETVTLKLNSSNNSEETVLTSVSDEDGSFTNSQYVTVQSEVAVIIDLKASGELSGNQISSTFLVSFGGQQNPTNQIKSEPDSSHDESLSSSKTEIGFGKIPVSVDSNKQNSENLNELQSVTQSANVIAADQLRNPLAGTQTINVSRGNTWNSFFSDPVTGKIYYMPVYGPAVYSGSSNNTAFEYSNLANFAANTNARIINLPIGYEGTYHAAINGFLYYVEFNTNNMIKVRISDGALINSVPLTGAGHTNQSAFNWGGFSDICFYVDSGNLLYVIWAAPGGGNMKVSRLNQNSLAIEQTWTIPRAKFNTGFAFIVNGIVYIGFNYYNPQINARYILSTDTYDTSYLNLLTSNANFTYITDMYWDPSTNNLFSQDNSRNLVYPAVTGNTAPSANSQQISVQEDNFVNITLTANDSDGNSLTYFVDNPSNGTLSGTAPNLTYTPNSNFNGADSFTFKVNDGSQDSNTATVSISVTPVNDAPSLSGVPSSATIDELAAYGFGASANDIDSPSNSLVFSLIGAPSGASINPSTGLFAWTPDETQGPGNYPFTVRVSDGSANTDASITLTVNEVNAAPSLSNVPASAAIDELALYSFTATASDSDVPVQTLTFSLVGAPAGASIGSTNGVFSWTPTEAQGDGSAYSFTVRVSDGVTNTDKPISLTVNEVNSAPVLNGISGKTVDEETLLSVTASASDQDLPANTLTYSLDAGFPSGMTIDGSTGVISWTPTEAQGAGDYAVTVRVTDNGTGNLSDAETFNVHVNEVNVAPILTAIGNSTIDEQVAFGFTAAATDADLPANTLTFSLVGAPSGASITAGGAFSWTPSEAQGPGSYTFTVKVTDNGTPSLSDEEAITITVNEVNRPPVLAAIGSQTGYWGNAFGFTASATDPDIPANVLTYTLIGAPAGASINPSSGLFAWTPTSAQIGSHTFTVRVTDNGSPNLYDEKSVTINVGKRPTALVYTSDGSEQYSDSQTLSATLTDNGGGAMQGLPLSGNLVGFAIGAQNTSASTNGSGAAMANLILTQDPAPAYTVASSFAGDSIYLSSSDSDAFDILQEDARAYYTGTLFVNTSCATCSSGTATLSATVRDITAETSDSAFDTFAGDIRNAKVTFVDRDSNTPIAGCSNLSVGLVNLADPKTGTAICNWNVNIGSADSMDYTIGIIVSNYYTRNVSAENSLLTVSKPIGTNFITGGGYLVNALSNGQYAGVTGLKSNFGFNVKYNNSGKSLQGRVNVIVRGNDGRTYQIKGNVMRTLSVSTVTNSPLVKAAVYTGKANMTDITDPLNPIALGGNNSFQMEMTDKGEPGSTDTIAITLWNDAGGLLYSSRWNGTRSVEQILGGGNLVVR